LSRASAINTSLAGTRLTETVYNPPLDKAVVEFGVGNTAIGVVIDGIIGTGCLCAYRDCALRGWL